MAVTQHTILPLEYSSFTISFHKFEAGSCVSISYGDVSVGTPVVRLHSSCLFGESLHALDCDCAKQLTSTLQLIKDNGNGVVAYEYAEGRGAGLENKIQALEIQRTKNVDTVEAFRLMGLGPDLRSYELSIEALRDLRVVSSIKFASENPHKIASIKSAGFEIVEILHPEIKVTKYNKPELLAKKHRLGYLIESV
jgi:GTP cyclohydrolase II